MTPVQERFIKFLRLRVQDRITTPALNATRTAPSVQYYLDVAENATKAGDFNYAADYTLLAKELAQENLRSLGHELGLAKAAKAPNYVQARIVERQLDAERVLRNAQLADDAALARLNAIR